MVTKIVHDDVLTDLERKGMYKPHTPTPGDSLKVKGRAAEALEPRETPTETLDRTGMHIPYITGSDFGPMGAEWTVHTDDGTKAFPSRERAEAFLDTYYGIDRLDPYTVGDYPPLDYDWGGRTTTTNKIVIDTPEKEDPSKRIPVEYNAYGKDAATLCDDLRILLDLGLDVSVVWQHEPKVSINPGLVYPPGVRGGYATGGIIPKEGVVLVNENEYAKTAFPNHHGGLRP
jgi:hypothetical protein